MFLGLILELVLEHEDFYSFPYVTAFQNKASATQTYSCGIGVHFCCYFCCKFRMLGIIMCERDHIGL